MSFAIYFNLLLSFPIHNFMGLTYKKSPPARLRNKPHLLLKTCKKRQKLCGTQSATLSPRHVNQILKRSIMLISFDLIKKKVFRSHLFGENLSFLPVTVPNIVLALGLEDLVFFSISDIADFDWLHLLRFGYNILNHTFNTTDSSAQGIIYGHHLVLDFLMRKALTCQYNS